MKQRLAIVMGVVAAMFVAAIGLAGPASAANDASISATKLEKNTKKAKKKAKKVCKKAKKLRKSKNASTKAKKRAKKSCAKAKKKSKKLNRKLKFTNAQYFDVCKRGCKYRTIQEGANAAGAWKFKNKKRTATVRVQPGTYVEGVILHGKQAGRDFTNLRIIGVKKNKTPNPNARAVVLEGKDAKTDLKGQPGWNPEFDERYVPAQNAIEGRSITGLTMKNMWARNYLLNTFFVWASRNPDDGERCADYNMDNLVSSDTVSYGLFARHCFGGRMTNSEGWNHGDSALYIGETPCDSVNWNNRDQPAMGPCQKDPKWTIVDNIKSHQNVLGYSGTNSKYVEIKNSAFYNNGAGLVPNTLDSEDYEPSGWLKFHDNDVFWNNYNYYSTGSEFKTVSDGLGKILGQTVNYPIGIGIMLFGTDGVISENNNVFGNEKFGVMTFSAPGAFGANDDDDAKNLNNQFIGNKLGRDGADPNGTDFLSDNTGGGNCFQDNGPNPTYVLGNGSVPADTIYPKSCPQPLKLNKDTSSFDPTAGIQVDLSDEENGSLLNPDTVLGYAASEPAKEMECSWRGNTHPPYTDEKGYTYTEKRADPVVCP
ncbi:MAG: hypothetical protein M3Y23_01885 [Actinomycetota bacterium]|nr:hypothetical protein [Actinomycetota bacterium]